jgi:hypothetical protein
MRFRLANLDLFLGVKPKYTLDFFPAPHPRRDPKRLTATAFYSCPVPVACRRSQRSGTIKKLALLTELDA